MKHTLIAIYQSKQSDNYVHWYKLTGTHNDLQLNDYVIGVTFCHHTITRDGQAIVNPQYLSAIGYALRHETRGFPITAHKDIK